MDLLSAMWRFAGFLGAALVILFLAFLLFCLLAAIVKEARKGRGRNDR